LRFVPDVRLDDLMLSYASDGGGVGPHVDSYDVFLLQVAGRRRWRWARAPRRPVLRDDVPLKMLARMPAPHAQQVLEPGDLLYLPPGWAHEGTAVGTDCMTASIGFRSPTRDELARALLGAMADAPTDDSPNQRRYRDAGATATLHPGQVPAALQVFARDTIERALAAPGAVQRALGCWLTEPKPQVWFEADDRAALGDGQGVVLDRRTRMAWDAHGVYVNGESFVAAGRDAALARRLADARSLSPAEVRRLSDEARALLAEWLRAGWVQARDAQEEPG
jgi:50S ribosomal protein L16 3-hydroxylase